MLKFDQIRVHASAIQVDNAFLIAKQPEEIRHSEKERYVRSMVGAINSIRYSSSTACMSDYLVHDSRNAIHGVQFPYIKEANRSDSNSKQ